MINDIIADNLKIKDIITEISKPIISPIVANNISTALDA